MLFKRILTSILVAGFVFVSSANVIAADPPRGKAGEKVGKKSEDLTHMEEALRNLRIARTELQEAKSNKGGHRVNAIKLVEQAIDQVREGMKFAEEAR